jgi:hypothetical protein
MGKKSKFKKFSRIAASMPIIKTKRVVGSKIDGESLIISGVKEVEGKPVDLKATYRKKELVSAPMNHKKNMKKLYYMHGINGVKNYMQAVNSYAQRTASK